MALNITVRAIATSSISASSPAPASFRMYGLCDMLPEFAALEAARAAADLTGAAE
jgi:hypothetical protein